MARMTIYVADELKARIDDQKENVNWSEVACRAFEIRLGELAAAKQEKTMSEVIERLRASKLKSEDKMTAAGRESGRWWATHRAEYDALKRIAEIDSRDFCSDTPWNNAKNLAAAILYADENRDDYDRDEVEQVIRDVFDEVSESDEYLVGFIEGATEVFDEVKDSL